MCTCEFSKARTGAQEPESEKGIMKKFLTMGALALTLAAICVAPAPAWLNWKFGIGLNLGWQSGGNNTLWGLFRNGQPPGPECGGGLGGCPLPPGPGYGGAPFQPNSFNNNAVQSGPDAAPIRGPAVPNSYQTSQNPWSNYYNANTVGYRYPYYAYNYNYSYGYSR
jgi:hypothetical protein